MPGLYKIFDEILVNACDNFQRDPEHMTYVKAFGICVDDRNTTEKYCKSVLVCRCETCALFLLTPRVTMITFLLIILYLLFKIVPFCVLLGCLAKFQCEGEMLA